MFSKMLSLVVASTTSFTSSFTGANIEEYKAPESNYIQEAVDNGISVAKETGVSSAGISIIDRNSGKIIMRTSMEDAHKPMPLGSLGRIFIMIKAVSADKGIVNETQGNPVISMMDDYSKEDTDQLWKQHGGPALVRELMAKYDLQETIVGSNWDNTQSSSVDISRLIRRFLDDPDITENQKKWTIAMLGSTSTSVNGQDFTYGLPSARGVQNSGENNGNKQQNQNVAWIQGSPMDSNDGLYRHTTGVFGADNNFIATIMVTFPEGTTSENADSITSQIAQASLSSEHLDSKKQQEKSQ